MRYQFITFLKTTLVGLGSFLALSSQAQNFGTVHSELKKYQPVIVLSSADSSQKLLICANYQARVMTSTSQGNEGLSYGWVNLGQIKSGKLTPHINAWGGEERIWFGPEGGQYSLFFEKGKPFTFDNWQVPAIMDTEPYTLVKATGSEAEFNKKFTMKNYSDFSFDVEVKRKIRLLSQNDLERRLSLPQNVTWVGYESSNTVTNKGKQPWTKEKGLFSIWLMGMFPANESVTTIVPLKGKNPTVNSDYFEALDSSRLQIKDSVVFFKTDGKYRSKIGVPYENSKDIIGSYDAKNKVLTVLIFKLPSNKMPFVKSAWKKHELPYEGDVTNSYNDGPKGAMYELESSSPALELKPKESYTHTQQTWHFQGEESDLKKVAKDILGVELIVHSR